MTHFVTLVYLRASAPYLVLLIAALLQPRAPKVARLMLAVAALAQIITWPLTQDEIFSRQLAHDRFAAISFLLVVAIGAWRTETDLLACFAAAVLGATNDTFTLFVVWAVLCQTRGAPRMWWSWLALGYLVASGVRQMGVSEFGVVTQMSSPLLWLFVAVVVGALLLWSRPRWVDVIAWSLPLGRLALLVAPVDASAAWVLR